MNNLFLKTSADLKNSKHYSMLQMFQGNLSREANKSVKNILIFISDSHRYDELPDKVRSMGVAGRAAAASCHTPSGYPSILTGLYPSSHQVWEFEDSLMKQPTLFEQYSNFGIDATHVWSNVDEPAKKPPLSICGETEQKTIHDLDPPFVHVVHDRGGHMQYGPHEDMDRWESPWEFFDEYENKPREIKRLYRESLTESAEYFQTIVEVLKSRGIFHETLVIFTSDHGELLGEYGGLYTHGSPIVPELVNVPLVFAGAGLPRNKRFEGLLSTTDVAPTALAAIGACVPDLDGCNVWTEQPKRRVARTEMWQQSPYPKLINYKTSSVWTADGGYVRHLNGFLGRFGHVLVNKIFRSPYSNIIRKSSKDKTKLLKLYLSMEVTYGTAPDVEVVENHLETDFSKTSGSDISPSPNTEQLRDLGYLE